MAATPHGGEVSLPAKAFHVLESLDLSLDTHQKPQAFLNSGFFGGKPRRRHSGRKKLVIDFDIGAHGSLECVYDMQFIHIDADGQAIWQFDGNRLSSGESSLIYSWPYNVINT